MKFLVAEHDDNSKARMVNILESKGHTVVSTSNGVEALEVAQSSSPDIIFADILMPMVDGLDLCRMVKKDKQLQKIPFLYYAVSHKGSGDIQFARSQNTSRFIIESISMTDFLNFVTECKYVETEKARLKSRRQHLQKMEAVGQLAGGIAHNFNNILAIIIGYSEIAMASCSEKGDTETGEKLGHILEASKRAEDLVANMLIFSRKETRKYTQLQLQPLIEEVFKRLRSELPASIEINSLIEQNLPAVKIDDLQLNQLMMNLCTNASDAMGSQGTINIRLGWHRRLDAKCSSCRKHVEGDWVELSVTDTGTGIKANILEHIFDPFYTTKDVGNGTGMGLSVIHGIMHNQGGHILLQTEERIGSSFRLLFPPIFENNLRPNELLS